MLKSLSHSKTIFPSSNKLLYELGYLIMKVDMSSSNSLNLHSTAYYINNCIHSTGMQIFNLVNISTVLLLLQLNQINTQLDNQHRENGIFDADMIAENESTTMCSRKLPWKPVCKIIFFPFVAAYPNYFLAFLSYSCIIRVVY
ncbi:hypothetical protein KSF78_0009602 [Schistosoma japonicum]|nr:hypothetical protein KSF78_0009602 [Schistosoma japonicum]